MPCLSFRTHQYYLPPSPLTLLRHESNDAIPIVSGHRGCKLSAYFIFYLKCIGIFFLLNGIHYITKYIQDSTPTLYDKYHIDDIRGLQCFVAWGLFTILWNIILSYNINISNNKQKYKQIISDTSSESNYKIKYKIQQIKHSRCNIFKIWHISLVVFIYDCIAYFFLQYTHISYSIISFDDNTYFCRYQFKCNALSIDDLIHDVFGFCFVFLCSSLTLMLFDIMLCRRLKRVYLKLSSSNQQNTENSLSTPLVSFNSTPGSELDMVGLSNIDDVKEIIHIHHGSTNRSESPLIYSTLYPSTKGSLTTNTMNPTPIPSSFKNISYLGNSNTINDSCINVWCLNVFQSIAFFMFFFGIEFIGHWEKELIENHFEKWTLILLAYIGIWRYIMTRIGRFYDGLRIFSFTDHNSELNTMIKSKQFKEDELYDNNHNIDDSKETQSTFNKTQYFVSIELILYIFVMSIYYIMIRIYLIYYDPTWKAFGLSLLFHILSELFENGLKTSKFYYRLTYNLYFLFERRHQNDVCMRRIVGLFRDESKFILWRERISIDISIKIIISGLSCLAAICLNISEYFGYLNINNNDDAKFTSHQCAMSALRVGITAAIELILYISIYYISKRSLFESFTRIITTIWEKNKFVWIFMITFIMAGLSYAGKNI